MPSAPASDLVPHAFPSRIADLGFSLSLPRGFALPELPPGDPDFSNPTTMHPIGVGMSQVALAVLSVSARPAYDDGSVMDWLRYLADEQGLTLSTLMPGHVGPHPAVLADAHQEQDGMPLRLRLAALEDGARFLIIMAMSPAELWPSFGDAMGRALESFRLDNPRGPTAPLVPGTPVPALRAEEA